MRKTKKIELGVDIEKLEQQLSRVYRLSEENFNKSITSQYQYNSAIEQSLKLLDEQESKLYSIYEVVEEIQKSSASGNSNIQNNIVSQPILSGRESQANSSEELLDLVKNSDSLLEIVEDIRNYIKEEQTQEQNANVVAAPSDIGNVAGEESTQESDTSKKKGNQDAGKAFNSVAALSNQKNDIYMLAAATAAIPVVGQGVQMVLQRLLKAAEDLDTSKYDYYATTGSFDNLGGFNEIGLSTAESIKKQSEYKRRNINVSEGDLYFEKAYGYGGMSALLESLRDEVSAEDKMSKGGALSDIANRVLTNLSSSINPNQVRAYSEDYLNMLVEINRDQLATLGKTNTLITGEVLGALSSLSTVFENPMILQQMHSALKEGLQSASSPQLEALQYSALSKTRPDASLWEMQLIKEDPFFFSEYLQEYMNSLINMGTSDEAKFEVKNAFGLSASLADELVNAFLKGDDAWVKAIDVADMSKGVDYRSEALSATSLMQSRTAKTENLMAELGTPVMELTLDVVNKLENYIKGTENPLDDFKNWMGNAVDSLIDFDSIIQKIKGSFWSNSTPTPPQAEIKDNSKKRN